MFKNNNSLMHTLNPFIKLLLTIFFIISCSLATNFEAIGLLTLFLVIILLASNINIKDYLKHMWISIFNFLLIFILDLIINSPISLFLIITKSILITIAILLFAFTTKSSEKKISFELLLSPLKIFNINVHKMANLIVIYFESISIFILELKKVIKSQNNRRNKKNIKEKIVDIKKIYFHSKQKTRDIINNKIEIMKIKNYDFDNNLKYNYNLKTKEIDFLLVGMQLLLFVAIIVKR